MAVVDSRIRISMRWQPALWMALPIVYLLVALGFQRSLFGGIVALRAVIPTETQAFTQASDLRRSSTQLESELRGYAEKPTVGLLREIDGQTALVHADALRLQRAITDHSQLPLVDRITYFTDEPTGVIRTLLSEPRGNGNVALLLEADAIAKQLHSTTVSLWTATQDRRRRAFESVRAAERRASLLNQGMLVLAVLAILGAALLFGRRLARRLELLETLALGSWPRFVFQLRTGHADELTDLEATLLRLTDKLSRFDDIQTRYETVCRRSTDAILFLRRSGDISDASAAAADLFACEHAELIHRNVFDLGRGGLRKQLADLIIGGPLTHGVRYETEQTRDDGGTVPVEVSAYPIAAPGPDTMIVMIRDLSEHKARLEELSAARDEAMQVSRLKSEFLATMSHEIRTPMNAIVGMAECLQATPLDDDQTEFATIIRDAGRTLTTVINDILDFSKIEAGKLQIEPAPISCRTLVYSVKALFAGEAMTKGLALQASIDPELAPTLEVDPTRLRQVLINLVGNAMKFTEMGSVRIEVACVESDETAQLVEFSVEDTGIGIHPALRGRLFEPFVQGDGSRSRMFTGTGLGLSISKRLVELMGGEIGVDSSFGEGSRFWFRLRLRRSAAGVPATSLPAIEPHPWETVTFSRTGKPLRALVVEDNWMNQRVAVNQLKKFGFEVVVAENGYAGVAEASSREFDVIFMDCQMAGLDGLESTRAIRDAEQARKRRVPIIALTANVLQEERLACFAAGMDDYVAKPVTFHALAAVLRRCLPDAASVTTNRIDMDQLRLFVGDDPAEIGSFIKRAESSLTLMCDELEVATEQQDVARVRDITHDIRGACANIGALELAALGTVLSAAAKNGDWASLASTTQRMRDAVTFFVGQVQAEILATR